MAKDKITDYSATNASNSDVGGIGILGSNVASNMDNGLREIMTHLAETNAGTYPVADTWTFADPADLTKKFRHDAGTLPTATSHVIAAPWIQRKGADIASATSVDLSAATGNYIDITGTTTITAFGTVQAGTIFQLQFDGALTLTYNATSLILPSSEDLKVAAGDEITIMSLGSGNWKCIGFHPVLPYQVIESGSLPSANSLTISSIPQKFKRLALYITGMSFDTATRLANVQHNADASGYAGHILLGGSATSLSTVLAQLGATQAASETTSAIVDITNYQAGYFTTAVAAGQCRVTGTAVNFNSTITRLGTTAMTSLKVIMDSTGNFDAGTYALIGYY